VYVIFNGICREESSYYQIIVTRDVVIQPGQVVGIWPSKAFARLRTSCCLFPYSPYACIPNTAALPAVLLMGATTLPSRSVSRKFVLVLLQVPMRRPPTL
jgi:hypothetical protein